MRPHILLLVVLAVLIVVLEILNALFELLFNNQTAALEEQIERGRQESGVLSKIRLYARIGVSKVLAGMSFVSLIVHEFMHALVLGLSLHRPRIVVCKNGGYALPEMWSEAGLYKLCVLTMRGLLTGITGMAPLLGGSLVLYLTLRYAAPLPSGTLDDLAVSIAYAPTTGKLFAALGAAVGALMKALFTRRLWGTAVVLFVGFVLGRGLTPSSTDFQYSAGQLLGYAVGFLTAAALLPAKGALLAIGAIGLLGYIVLTRVFPRYGVPEILGGFSSTCGVLGILKLAGVLGPFAKLDIAAGLGGLLVMLLLATAMYVMLLALLFVLALVHSPSAAFVSRKQVGEHSLGIFESLVTPFHTCTSCKIHFRDRCDGCGCSIAEIDAAKANG